MIISGFNAWGLKCKIKISSKRSNTLEKKEGMVEPMPSLLFNN